MADYFNYTKETKVSQSSFYLIYIKCKIFAFLDKKAFFPLAIFHKENEINHIDSKFFFREEKRIGEIYSFNGIFKLFFHVYVWRKHANERQISVKLCVIHSITDNEFIGNLVSHVVCRNVGCSS